MLALQKADSRWSLFRNKSHNGSPAKVSISTASQPIENLLTREWLLTNEHGSYSSSSIVGCNTRGYHGLLIGSLNPPVNRIMALANCLEMVKELRELAEARGSDSVEKKPVDSSDIKFRRRK